MVGNRPWAALLGLIACSAPVLAAGYWLSTGVSGPVHQVSSPVVPELVAAAGGHGRQVRTLVVRSSGNRISFLLLRAPSPSLADAALTPPAAAERALSKVVSALTTPGGSLGADQAQLLADFDIGYVLVQAPVEGQLATELNNLSGLRPYSTTGRYSLWQLDTRPARVAVREPDGTIVPVASGAIGVGGVAVPAAGGTLMLAEPAGGWSASVSGHALAAVPSPAGSWAQAFRLPKGGGTLTVGHSGLTRDLLLILELLAFLIVAALALPGIHVAEQDEAVAAPGAEFAGADLAGADLHGADLDDADLDDSDLAGTAGDGLASTGLAATAGRAGAAAARGGDSGEPGPDVAPGRRGLAKSGRGRSQQGGRGTRGRGARGRDAARQRTGLTKRSRTAPAATGTSVPDGQEDAAETTLLATGPAGSNRGPRDEGRAGRRPGGQADGDGRLADAWPYDAGSDRSDGKLADAWPYNTGGDREPEVSGSRGAGGVPDLRAVLQPPGRRSGR